MATIKDVAQHAGVSKGTVSNVLNRPSYVSEATRERVLSAIAALGFEPQKTARQFRPGRERTLGLALADMGNPFFVDVALGAESEAKARGVGVVICHNGEDAGREHQNLDLLVQQRVQGIMITPVDERNPGLEELVQRGIPIVYVDRITGDRPCCSIAVDDTYGGRLAGEHLLAMGHRRIAFAGDLAIGRQVQERYRGLVEAVDGGSLTETVVEHLAAASWKLDNGRRVARELVVRNTAERPTAVFCANDMLALGMLQELVLQGIRVPQEIALVGFDDLEWAGAAAIPLSSVRQPRELVGRKAVRMILDEIDDGPRHVHQHLILTPELVVRDSSNWRRE